MDQWANSFHRLHRCLRHSASWVQHQGSDDKGTKDWVCNRGQGLFQLAHLRVNYQQLFFLTNSIHRCFLEQLNYCFNSSSSSLQLLLFEVHLPPIWQLQPCQMLHLTSPPCSKCPRLLSPTKTSLQQPYSNMLLVDIAAGHQQPWLLHYNTKWLKFINN